MPTLVIPAGPGPGRASFSVVPSLLAGTILLAGPVSCSSRPARTELVVAYPVDPTSLDPHEALEEFSISVLGNVYENLLHSPGAGFGAFNGGGYSNSTIDASIHEASRRSSLTDRWLAFRHLAELVRADVPVLPLVVATDVYASRRGLEFQPRLDRRIRAWDTRWRPAGLSNRNPCRRRPTGRDVASRAGRESGRRPHSTPHDDQPQDKGVEGQRQAKVFARSPAQSENPRDQSASPRDRGCP